MELIWYGHSCFMLDTDLGSVVFDPYEPDNVPGLMLPPLRADLCLCSHNHRDHNFSARVELSGKNCSLSYEGFPSFHDNSQGALRGENTIHLVRAGDFTAVHLGDLGHLLSEEVASNLRGADLLMIPVGGHFTIDAKQAAETVKLLQPKLVIPMHYRGEGFGYEAINEVSDFTCLMDKVTVLGTNRLDPTAFSSGTTAVPCCPLL